MYRARPPSDRLTTLGLISRVLTVPLTSAAVNTWDQKRQGVTRRGEYLDSRAVFSPMYTHKPCWRIAPMIRQMPQSERVQWVTMDMCRPYRVTRAFPQATIVIDKFHVLRMANAPLGSGCT